MKDRNYVSRNAIVQKFKPREHIFYDRKGLLHYKPKFRDQYMNMSQSYFAMRKEDLQTEHE